MLPNLYDRRSQQYVGPWRCEKCGHISQYAIMTSRRNRIFCRNESCKYERVIDKRHFRIIEDDGSHWQYDNAGNKWRVRAQ